VIIISVIMVLQSILKIIDGFLFIAILPMIDILSIYLDCLFIDVFILNSFIFFVSLFAKKLLFLIFNDIMYLFTCLC
jgi:hypothetical protein